MVSYKRNWRRDAYTRLSDEQIGRTFDGLYGTNSTVAILFRCNFDSIVRKKNPTNQIITNDAVNYFSDTAIKSELYLLTLTLNLCY